MAAVAAAGGFIAALPVAATAHAAPADGPVRLPPRWWSNNTPHLLTAIMAVTTAVIAYAVCLRVGWRISAPGYWLFSVLGVGLSYIDLRRHRLPHAMVGATWLTCAVLFTIESINDGRFTALAQAICSGLAVSAILLLVALVAPGQLGLGDVHFAGATAFTLGWLGWQVSATAILTALVAQWVLALVTVARSRDRSTKLPFGPVLFGASILATIFA
ncbi:prepilin peptidase [Paractinoplanes rishiriensis]|nr:prepilin peptidase [Actinoplanes rishiriensis]